MATMERMRDDHRSARAGDVDRQAARRETPAHPLIELQRQIGNEAVSRLLAVQRHSLDPEEEAGT